MNNLEKKIVEFALGERGLPVLARMGEDPGAEYFETVLSNLKSLFEKLNGSKALDKELAHALYCIGHYPYVEYSAWEEKGRKFRDDLIDPQILQIEMAVESIFCNEWLGYLNESE